MLNLLLEVIYFRLLFLNSFIAATALLLRQLLERDLLRGRLDSDGDTFIVLLAEPSDERLAEQIR